LQDTILAVTVLINNNILLLLLLINVEIISIILIRFIGSLLII